MPLALQWRHAGTGSASDLAEPTLSVGISALPWREVKKLDIVIKYIKEHHVDTRQMNVRDRQQWLQNIDPATGSRAKRVPP